MPRYRHIHIRALGEAPPKFQGKGGGKTKRPSAVVDRDAHAQALRADLESLRDELREVRQLQKEAGVARNRRGLPMTAESRDTESLVLGTMRSTSPGLKLLAVRRHVPSSDKKVEEAGSARDLATFFINPDSIESLLKSLDQYAAWSGGNVDSQDLIDEEDENEGLLGSPKRPKRFWLFESVEQFRLATIEDLWADAARRLPESGQVAEWEVWLRKGFEQLFVNEVLRRKIPLSGQATEFLETVLVNVVATREQVADLIRSTAAVVELRGASNFAADVLDLVPEGRLDLVGSLASRLLPPAATAPRTTILDTGVNRAHPLLAPALPRTRCHSIEPNWSLIDHDGHGTKSAGIALFGEDLERHLQEGAAGPIQLTTALESVAVIAPSGGPRVPARDAIVRAVESVEADPHPRVFCLAGTAAGEEDNGRQTSTSAALDKLAWGDGENSRLFCVAAGNVPTSPSMPYQHAQYEGRNIDHRIQPPGQSINALTVSANTDKTAAGLRLVAPRGDLAPTARTSQGWSRRYAFKPDIVMEGGNHEKDPDGLSSRYSHSLMVLTTNRNSPQQPLGLTCETSAATANAAGLATRLLARYPRYRMETLRALMIHAAEWTPAMRELHTFGVKQGDSDAMAWSRVFSCYGWGVPNEERLFESASNVLTLVVEDELKPYKRVDGRISLNEMKYFKLPWPADALKALNQEEVEMRCTLSYFADPDPLADSRDRRDRYASHGLRFDLKRFGESDERAQQRVNELAEVEAADIPSVATEDDGWIVGFQKRRLGSVHHDIWTGKAFRLAERDGLSVYPVKGWWSDRTKGGYEDKSVRFSLVVSIRTPPADVDLMVEAIAKVPAELLVESLATIET